jgi:Holliday junction resolvase RusA-like endonuclease
MDKVLMHAKPHCSKPDLDGLIGGVWDALLPDGDAHIWRLGESSKVWWDYDAIIVERSEGV